MHDLFIIIHHIIEEITLYESSALNCQGASNEMNITLLIYVIPFAK